MPQLLTSEEKQAAIARANRWVAMQRAERHRRHLASAETRAALRRALVDGRQVETRRDGLLVRIEDAAPLKPAEPTPLPSRLYMLAREIRVLQHTYDQLLADYAQDDATAA